MRAAALGLAGAVLLLLAAPASADIGDFLGKPVASVRITAEGRAVADPRLLMLIETPVGTPLSVAAVRETVTHLFALGRYEDVVVHADTAATGVALVYDLVPLHPIDTIRFAGAIEPGVDPRHLRRVVRERYGEAPLPANQEAIARAVAEDLHQRGYRRARVTPAVQLSHDPDRATLTLTIEPGTRTRIGVVEVAGVAADIAPPLLNELRLQPGKPYEPEAIDARVRKYEEHRRSDGFLGATARVVFTLDAEERVANGTLTVAPGSKVRVEFKGDPLPGSKQSELVPIEQEATVNEDTLEDFRQRIEDYFHQLGFRDAKAEHTEHDVNGVLVVTYTINRGPAYRVADVQIDGARSVSLSDLQPFVRLGSGQPFTRAALERDVSSLEEFYRRQGFSAVTIDQEVTPLPATGASEVPLLVRLSVVENALATIESVQLRGNTAMPDAELRAKLSLQPGQPFYATQMVMDRDTIQLEYANRGYQNATVSSSPGLSGDGRRANVIYAVNPGPRLIVDHVLIVGNERTRTETIERELRIKPGDPLGLSAVLETQRRLVELGLFRRVRITQVDVGDEALRDVLVSIEESPATTIGYGGGLEVGARIRTSADTGAAVQRLEFAPRAFFEVGRRNLFDKNRSINLFTRISLRPADEVTPLDPTAANAEGYDFSEYRVLGTYREPRIFGTVADGFVTGTVEQQVRSSFDFARRAFNFEVARALTREVSLSGNYQIQWTKLFNERIAPDDKPTIDRLFPQLLLSSVSASIVDTTRDDIVDPTKGRYLSANGQLAPERLGSEVGFVKSYFTAQFFRSMPFHSTVLATSARLGMAYRFAEDVPLDDGGQPVVDAELVQELPASERFFAGGDTTVRGFPLDSLGTPETLDKNGFALGGNALVIFNVELRTPIKGGFGVVGFLDTGNVFARTTDIDLGDLRSSAGFGIRYKSPVGPIRIDLGFKLGRQIVGGVLEPLTALHLSLGQAF